ncbi:MAG: glycosyltransferase, partial [Fimbriiglobus sp.]
SDGQAAKVRRCRVSRRRTTVIRNAARLGAFAAPDPAYRDTLLSHFADTPVSYVVVAAGRLSPEKGFGVLADAAAGLLGAVPTAGVVLFGEGPERDAVEARVRELGISDRFRLAGFTRDLDKLLPWADVLAIPSFTEGLPNVALEASAAGVPVVATAVGGNAEVVADRETGFIVPSGDPAALAGRLAELLRNDDLRRKMGHAARARMHARFTFEAQAAAYVRLFAALRAPARPFCPRLEAAA